MTEHLLYEYAYWGVIHHIKVLNTLYKLCKEVEDEKSTSEYEMRIEKSKEDFVDVVNNLGFDLESSMQVLEYEIKKGI